MCDTFNNGLLGTQLTLVLWFYFLFMLTRTKSRCFNPITARGGFQPPFFKTCFSQIIYSKCWKSLSDNSSYCLRVILVAFRLRCHIIFGPALCGPVHGTWTEYYDPQIIFGPMQYLEPGSKF